jgi:hypothetical protein
LNFLKGKKITVIFILCLCSCASGTAVRDNRPSVYLSGNAKYILLPPEDIENSIDMVQQISASYGGQDFLLNAWVKADETGMEMTLLNELGANMGELSYRNGSVSFSSPMFPPSLKPEYIVADFQFCFYNELPLRQALEHCGLAFEHTERGRRILQGKTVIIEIEKSAGLVKLVNHLRGCTYTLEGEFK